MVVYSKVGRTSIQCSIGLFLLVEKLGDEVTKLLLSGHFQAAQYAIKRRQYAEELCSDATEYPDPDPLINSGSMEFYGQRYDYLFQQHYYNML